MKTKPRGLSRIFLLPWSANWWLQYYVKGAGGRAKLIRESSRSTKRSDAIALLKKRTGQIGSGSFLDPSIARTIRLSDLKKLVEDNYAVNDYRTAFALKGNFGRLTAHFGDVGSTNHHRGDRAVQSRGPQELQASLDQQKPVSAKTGSKARSQGRADYQ
jgi:hypothetical protein